MSANASSPFLRLPTELKVKIVKTVHEQDKRLVDDIELTRKIKKLPAEFGNGIRALSATNRELRAFAVPFLFQTIRLSQTANSLFSFGILPAHIPHIRELAIDYAASFVPIEDFRQLLSSLILLPNLKSFVVWDEILLDLLGPDPFNIEDDEEAPKNATKAVKDEVRNNNLERQRRRQAIEGLRTLASRAQRLEIVTYGTFDEQLFLMFNNLIELYTPRGYDGMAPRDESYDLFASRSGLSSFSGRIEVAQVWRKPIWSSYLTMRSLDLDVVLDFPTWTCICQFVNLEHLSLELRDVNEVQTDLSFLQTSTLQHQVYFSNLETLSIASVYRPGANVLVLTRFLFSLDSPPPIIKAVILIWPEDSAAEGVLSAFQDFPPTLRQLDVLGLGEYAPETYLKLKQHCSTALNNIKLAGKEPKGLLPLFTDKSRELTLDEIGAATDELLAWAGQRMRYLTTTNDSTEAKLLLEQLRKLNSLRLICEQ